MIEVLRVDWFVLYFKASVMLFSLISVCVELTLVQHMQAAVRNEQPFLWRHILFSYVQNKPLNLIVICFPTHVGTRF